MRELRNQEGEDHLRGVRDSRNWRASSAGLTFRLLPCSRLSVLGREQDIVVCTPRDSRCGSWGNDGLEIQASERRVMATAQAFLRVFPQATQGRFLAQGCRHCHGAQIWCIRLPHPCIVRELQQRHGRGELRQGD